MRDLTRVLLVVGTMLCWTGAASAQDLVGGVGTPVGLQVNTTSAETYLTFHGRLFVKAADGTLVEYRWGGSTCGMRVLSEPQVAALQAALNNNKMRIQPLYQLGQADLFCVVGFTVVPKSAVKLVIP